MSKLGDREELLPTDKQYSIVILDSFKPPTHDEFAIKVGEIDSLEKAFRIPGHGESVVILDQDGNSVPMSGDSKRSLDNTTDDGSSR